MTEDLPSQVSDLLARRSLDLVDSREVVRWAASRVADGASNEDLIYLAGQSLAPGAEIDAALSALAHEFGLSSLTESQAGMIVARSVARSLAQGALEPIDATRQIWRIARLAPASEPALRIFIGLASEWEDDPENRGQYEEEIRSCALRLAGSAE